MSGLAFDPLLPWPLVGGLAALALLVALWSLWRGLRGWAWRGIAGLAAAAALAGPALESGIRHKLSDIVILLDDRSASQSLPGRAEQTDAAVEELTRQLSALPDTEIRRVTVGDDPDGTQAGTALTRALAAEPQARLAGVIAVTDGLAHDAPMVPASAPAPVHVLLTGQAQDWDRRLVIEEAPAYGLIGKPVTIRLRVEDQGAVPVEVAQTPARLRILLDGEEMRSLDLPPGVTLDLPVVPAHAGQNVVSIAFDPPEAAVPELTDRNNAAAVQIQGVRDRLRVLLVSGAPHAGERTWRNLLKSDANVDLIHFTILRPPDKMDAVPVEEMSLIAFPTQELFMERIRDFDLIIFDRYRVRGILLPQYYDNIRRYVEEGGAILVSAGPEMSSVESLNLSPLGAILPARPTGRVYDEPFLPRLTDEGERHPVTAGLQGAPVEGSQSHWGRWLRMSQVIPDPRTQVVLSGARDEPLLLLSRV
ncbi:membrane protein, partial [Paracoccus versutus]